MTLAAERMAIAPLVFLIVFRGLPALERRLGREWRWLSGMKLVGMGGGPVDPCPALRVTTGSGTSHTFDGRPPPPED